MFYAFLLKSSLFGKMLTLWKRSSFLRGYFTTKRIDFTFSRSYAPRCSRSQGHCTYSYLNYTCLTLLSPSLVLGLISSYLAFPSQSYYQPLEEDFINPPFLISVKLSCYSFILVVLLYIDMVDQEKNYK